MSRNRREVLAHTGLGGLAAAFAMADRDRQAAASGAPAKPAGGFASGATGDDIPGIALRYAFSISIYFEERIRIQSPGGRAFVPAVGGEIWGPRLRGRVVPYGGADYGGGGGPLDAHYVLEADNGDIIYINNRAYMKVLGEVPAEFRDPGPAGPGEPFSQRMGGTALAKADLRMRTTPFFDAPKGPHEWMSRTLFVGHGARHVNPDHTIFTYYEVL